MDEATDEAAAAAADALRRATRSTQPRRATSGRTSPSRSGGRDPAPVSVAMQDLLSERGWTAESAIAVLRTRWSEVVGDEVAGHVAPEGFEDGSLTLRADSTAWATQVRLLAADLHRVIDEAVGGGVVRGIRVVGPQAPSWSAGPRRVKGRGPRDTYG
jgi:predicted nucleic acid-binding Zn ribbon protein